MRTYSYWITKKQNSCDVIAIIPLKIPLNEDWQYYQSNQSKEIEDMINHFRKVTQIELQYELKEDK